MDCISCHSFSRHHPPPFLLSSSSPAIPSFVIIPCQMFFHSSSSLPFLLSSSSSAIPSFVIIPRHSFICQHPPPFLHSSSSPAIPSFVTIPRHSFIRHHTPIILSSELIILFIQTFERLFDVILDKLTVQYMFHHVYREYSIIAKNLLDFVDEEMRNSWVWFLFIWANTLVNDFASCQWSFLIIWERKDLVKWGRF